MHGDEEIIMAAILGAITGAAVASAIFMFIAVL